MRRASMTAVMLWAVSALAEPPGPPRLSVRRAEAEAPGAPALQLDAALQQALAEEAAAPAPAFALVAEYEAEVVVGVRGADEEGGLRVTFDLSTTRPPQVKDRVVVDLPRPEVSAAAARTLVRAVALRSRALLEQAQLLVDEAGSTSETPLDGRPGPLALKVPARRQWSRFDVSVMGGVGTPAGFIGGRAAFNPFGYVGLTFAAGYSSWGPRVAPGVRVYPWGLDLVGLYAELDALISLGEGASVTVAGQTVAVQLKSTLSVAPMLGYRQQLRDWLVADVFLGWSGRLASENVARDDGAAVERPLRDALDGRQPQGFLAGVSLGASFF
jgi:hypothetical protein